MNYEVTPPFEVDEPRLFDPATETAPPAMVDEAASEKQVDDKEAAATRTQGRAIIYSVIAVLILQMLSLVVGATNNSQIREQGELIKQLQEKRVIDELKAIREVTKAK